MVKFHIPAVENAKVGDTVTVVLYNDNNLNPPTGDLSIYLDWNVEVLKYESSTFKQGRTTAADIVGLHNLNIMAADTTNGFPQGDNPLIEMKFKVVGPGYTPIVIKVATITDTSGANISSKAVVRNGAVTATGTAVKTTGTTGVTAGATTVATPGTVQSFTPLPTTIPVSGVTTGAISNPVTAVPVVSGPATVPSGTGVFSVTSIGNVPVGAIGTVQVVVDNAWQPPFSDTYVDIKYDPSMIRYSTSSIHVANTTAASKSDGMVRIMLGDFRNGYPQGKYPLADITFTALREGTTPLTVSVDHVRYWNSDFTTFTDISSTASTQSGAFSTGPVAATVATLAPVTVNPSVTYETVAPIGTVQAVGTVASEATAVPVFLGSNNRDTDEYTGVTTKTATPTPTSNLTQNTTVPTIPPTTVTTVATPTPNLTQNTTVTTPPTTVTTVPTTVPTTTKAALPFGVLVLVALASVALLLQRTRR